MIKLIGIISDTHDNVANILKAVEIFKVRAEMVIHLGDIIAPATIQFFKDLKIAFLKGNCDGDIELLKKKKDLFAEMEKKLKQELDKKS